MCAFGAKKIFPIDTQGSVAVGVKIPFNAPAVYYSTYTTKDALKSNLINFFLTNKKERYLNNEFGANLRAFVFEQITNGNLDFLKQDVQNLINQYFTSIIVQSLDINKSEDQNSIEMVLFYEVRDTGINDNLSITFS